MCNEECTFYNTTIERTERAAYPTSCACVCAKVKADERGMCRKLNLVGKGLLTDLAPNLNRIEPISTYEECLISQY